MFLDTSLLVNPKKFEGIEKDITCPICQGILNIPYFCNKCQNNFCNICINQWKEKNPKCPFRCESPEYIENKFLLRIFSELIKFKCEKGCEKIISYDEINTHFENCKNENFKDKYYEEATKVEILKVQMEDYNDLKEELENTKNELEEITEQKNDLENLLEEAQDEQKRLDYELNERIEELENEVNEVREEKKELEKELKGRIVELENELSNKHDLELKVDKLNNENEDIKKELNEEKEKNTLLENKIQNLEEKISVNTKKEKDYENKINKLKNSIQYLVRAKNKLNDELVNIKKKKNE